MPRAEFNAAATVWPTYFDWKFCGFSQAILCRRVPRSGLDTIAGPFVDFQGYITTNWADASAGSLFWDGATWQWDLNSASIIEVATHPFVYWQVFKVVRVNWVHGPPYYRLECKQMDDWLAPQGQQCG